MYEAIACECKRAFSGPAFWLAVAATVIVMMLDVMSMALPVLCVIPCASSYLDDIGSGFIKACLPRTKTGYYITGKVVACMLSGGLALVMGRLFYEMISALIFLLSETASVDGAAGQPWFPKLWNVCVLLFCSGAFWSLTGMLFGALTDSKYMAYASPFIIYYVLIILKEQYLKQIYIIDPREWIGPNVESWVFGRWGVIILLSLGAWIAALLFGLTAAGRLERI